MRTMINEDQPGKSHEVTKDEMDMAIENALLAYEKVMFCIPYLADYVKKDSGVSGNTAVARRRGV